MRHLFLFALLAATPAMYGCSSDSSRLNAKVDTRGVILEKCPESNDIPIPDKAKARCETTTIIRP